MLFLRPYISGWPGLPLRTMGTSGPELQLRAMSGSIALLQPGSVLMSIAPDDWELGCYLLELDCHAVTGAMLTWVT